MINILQGESKITITKTKKNIKTILKKMIILQGPKYIKKYIIKNENIFNSYIFFIFKVTHYHEFYF